MNSYRDTLAAIAFLRSANTITNMRVDPKRIIPIGYSNGGPVVLRAVAADPEIRAMALLDGTDLRDEWGDVGSPAGYEKAALAAGSVDGVVSSGKAMIDEYMTQRDDWNPVSAAPGLLGKDVLIVDASKGNGLVHVTPSLSDALRDKARLTKIVLDTDHSFLDHRIALTRTVLNWLRTLR